MFKKTLKIALATLVATSLPQAWAGQYYCQGTVDFVGLNATGDLALKLTYFTGGASPIHYVCNINNATPGGMDAGTCKAVYQLALGAKTQRQQVQLYYNNGASCSTLGNDWAVWPVNFVSTVTINN